ncbi:uncharacterized protein DDB_G0283357 isoform X2 [Eupeodes corollae]|uniref:uncharacterized protein DDB_G0283357 isoform X2 n=1 Tax=Eupeodes corollae TaxID=290404 RepID=UPI00248F5CE9|nr:uncharacterized protein DDB_G0283357 isoform X2 [Eupeodes corollae]
MQFLMSFRVVLVLLAMVVAGMCVPTSVLAKNTELNSKVKRSSNEKTQSLSQAAGNREHYNEYTTNNKISNMENLSAPTSNTATSLNTALSGPNTNIDGHQEQQLQNQQQQQQQQQQHHASAPILQKRGVNSQLLYGGADLYNNPISSAALANGGGGGSVGGVWSDEIDPPLMYSDLQELQDEYPRGQYRSNNKGYDNLQNILNSEAYLEPFAMPLQYSSRYYGDRKKRSNNKLNNLKRESKLTPADMLALVALVEAGERSRKESEPDTYTIPETYFPSAKSYYPNTQSMNMNNNNNYEYQNNDDNDISSPWVEPSIVDYYGVPYNLDAMPKYEIAREHKYGINRYPAKRFMVSKKKRSLGSGRFLAEPMSAVSLTPERYAKLSKSQKYF